MTAWSDIQKVPEMGTPFVDEDDWNELVYNDWNLNERISALEALYTGGSVPMGGIMMWYGLASEVPVGWHICDGTNGLPDLRGSFIQGADDDEDLGAAGGNTGHTHSGATAASAGAHTHGIPTQPSLSGPNGTVGILQSVSVAMTTGGHAHTANFSINSGGEHTHTIGQTNEGTNLPPYKKLYWIGRIP